MSDAPAPTRAEEGRETGQDDLAARFALEERTALIGDLTDLQVCLSVDGRAHSSEIAARAVVALTAAEAEVARLTAALAGANDRPDLPRSANHEQTCQHCTAMPGIVATAQALYEAERDHVMAGEELAALDHQLSLPQSVEAVQALLPARRGACESASAALKKRQAAQDAVGQSLLPLVRQDSTEKAGG